MEECKVCFGNGIWYLGCKHQAVTHITPPKNPMFFDVFWHSNDDTMTGTWDSAPQAFECVSSGEWVELWEAGREFG